jgi:Fic-DOC domain mobile mystery protein B
MFQDVWRWAGEYRRSDKNLGVPKEMIRDEIGVLLGDATYWVENETYDADEMAVRFHHRLVWIHPFPNGNGRHSRLAADVLATTLDRPRFSWGRGLENPRQRYIDALKTADNADIAPLLGVARD